MFIIIAATVSLHRAVLGATVRLGLPGHARCGRAMSSAARPKRDLVDKAQVYFSEIDAAAFSNVLEPHGVAIKWNPRLRRTAGRCLFLVTRGMENNTRRAEIELSPRVLSTPERLRSTLAHEM